MQGEKKEVCEAIGQDGPAKNIILVPQNTSHDLSSDISCALEEQYTANAVQKQRTHQAIKYQSPSLPRYIKRKPGAGGCSGTFFSNV
mmetsp:Transcript_18762/g.37619  ORF Transcript_18762/g.37619 Transcript_18762/m.37619 type:complete len:87 (-) Transcript_18762:648-908(-)